MYSQLLEQVIARTDLSSEDMEAIMNQMMQGELTQAQIGAFLVGMRMKGETPTEIAAAAAIMRKHATPIDTRGQQVVDTCGTGGDGANTVNISTAAAIVAAAAGVRIAKHGNRSVSSKSGSADVLRALGVNIEIGPEQVADCIAEVGIGFLFAPMLHGAMKHAIGPRRELGVRTLFNMIGPLSNPAAAQAQVVGVFHRDLTPVFAKVLAKLGLERALVVHGLDGLDEITTTATTQVSELKDGAIATYELNPDEFFTERATLAALRGGEPEENARIIRDVFAGAGGAVADIIALNAAAAIYVGNVADSLKNALEVARLCLASGAALQKLDQLAARTQA